VWAGVSHSVCTGAVCRSRDPLRTSATKRPSGQGLGNVSALSAGQADRKWNAARVSYLCRQMTPRDP
jgi:hypothetical protein